MDDAPVDGCEICVHRSGCLRQEMYSALDMLLATFRDDRQTLEAYLCLLRVPQRQAQAPEEESRPC